jgi:hypothetical protein
MDIRPKQQTETKPQDKPKQSAQSEKASYKAGTINTADAKLILPPAVQTKLSALTQKYGIPFDLGNIGLDGKMADNIKAFRAITDMVEGDSKLLPEMLKLIKRLMRSEIKLAQFHRGVVTASINHQKKIDKYTADIFLKMAGYQQNASKREHRTNVRDKLIAKRTEAYTSYYDNTVYGEESKIIDAEFSTLASNKKLLSEGKQQRINLDQERKQKIHEYVQSAYQN